MVNAAIAPTKAVAFQPISEVAPPILIAPEVLLPRIDAVWDFDSDSDPEADDWVSVWASQRD